MLDKIKARFVKRADNTNINQFGIFITLSICIAGGLMGISLWLYNDSGAAQLDLSRPSYQAAREESAKEEKAEKEAQTQEDFAADGAVNEETLKQFKEIYKLRLEKVKANAFRADPLSDDSLHILDTETE